MTDAVIGQRESLPKKWLYVLATTNPPKGTLDPVSKWLWITRAGVLPMVLATRKAPPHYRALGLAVATGASYALTAALTKQVVTIIDRHGVEGLFTHWPVVVDASVQSEPLHLALHTLLVVSAVIMSA